MVVGTALPVIPAGNSNFAIRHRARCPISLFVLGFILAGGAYAANLYGQAFLDLGPRERIVDGERHLTLTGWDPSLSWWDRWRSGKDRLDYSLIRDRPNLVVLQMANEDVNDGALANLLGQDHLRELDLNGAHITDEGLPFLSQLPELQELRLARTAITDEGFKKYLADKKSLMKLDLTGTAVKGKTKRDWKKEQEGRQYLD